MNVGRKKKMKGKGEPKSVYGMNLRQINSRLKKKGAEIDREGGRYFLFIDGDYVLSGHKEFVVMSCINRGLLKRMY